VVVFVVVVVVVGLDEDDDSRFLFTMLDRPTESTRGAAWGGQKQRPKRQTELKMLTE
jgi:hypothetical protein